jgi:hypothetical protein
MCMLQGVRLLQVEAMPTCGLAKSSSPKTHRAQHGAAGVCLFRRRRGARSGDRLGFFWMIELSSSGAELTPYRSVRPDNDRLRAPHCASAPTARPGRSFGIPRIQIDVHPARRLGTKRFRNRRRNIAPAKPEAATLFNPQSCCRVHRRSPSKAAWATAGRARRPQFVPAPPRCVSSVPNKAGSSGPNATRAAPVRSRSR